MIFHAEIEGRPIDRWLLDSVRNGNGDVSPRLAVALLHLARERSPRQSENVDAPPLFTSDAVARAMTEVSELSFSEVVNDSKVASSFVLNCRAAKRSTFTLAEVENLFEPGEGAISEQVRMLERLGFLERVVVVETGAADKSMFRIPELYTRCWEHKLIRIQCRTLSKPLRNWGRVGPRLGALQNPAESAAEFPISWRSARIRW